MQVNASQLLGARLTTSDGRAAKLQDVLIDDRDWKVRYAVVTLGRWLPGRPVLLPPDVLSVCFASESRRLSMSREDIEKAPDLTTKPPVSWRRSLPSRLFRWRPQWGVAVPAPEKARADPGEQWAEAPGISGEQAHLRSVQEILRYAVVAVDGPRGRLMDVTIDAEAPTVTHLRVDSGTGRPLDVPTTLVRSVDWSKASISLSCQTQSVLT